MEDPSQNHGGEQDELEIGFHCSDPDLVIPQINQISLSSRSLGFETLVNITDDQMTNDIQKLLDEGVFPLVISSMNEKNVQIIGLVCTAARHLAGVAPENFRELVETVPFDYLLSIPNVPEVIDFLQFCTLNFPEFAHLLLNVHEQALSNSLGVWLQNDEETIKSALELINSLVQFQDESEFDFSLVGPFTDGQYSVDIRALALNILCQAKTEDTLQYLQKFFEMFMNEKPTPIVFQIIHDGITDKFFMDLIPQIYERSIKYISVPDSAVVLADISPNIDQESRENIITLIFQQSTEDICIERADSLFRICSDNHIELPQECVEQLVHFMDVSQSEEVLQCIEAILKQNSNYFTSADLQLKLLPVFDREPQFSVYAFKVILACCASCEVAQPILQAFNDFAGQNESAFDESFHAEVSKFIDSHQA